LGSESEGDIEVKSLRNVLLEADNMTVDKKNFYKIVAVLTLRFLWPLVLFSTMLACSSGGGGGGGSSGENAAMSQYYEDLQTVSTRAASANFPRLGNDTQVSWLGCDNSDRPCYSATPNGDLGEQLFNRLHWYDYMIIDGNNSTATGYNLSSYLGQNGTIRALNPNAIEVAYFSIADVTAYPPAVTQSAICYAPLLTYYAFGPDFTIGTCVDPGNDDFPGSYMLHDINGNLINLWNFGTYYSHIPDPNQSGFRARYIDAVNQKIVANLNMDGVYHDWGGNATLPNLGGITTVSLLNNGVDNLGGTSTANLTNLSNPVNQDWQNGLIELYSTEHADYPSDFIITGNSGWGGQALVNSTYLIYLQGTQSESFLEAANMYAGNAVTFSSGPGWAQAMYTYAMFAVSGASPNFALLQANLSCPAAVNAATSGNNTPNYLLFDLMWANQAANSWYFGDENLLASLRFALASALMFNGYFATSCTNATGGGYSAAFWIDELSVNSSGTAVIPTDTTGAPMMAAKGWLGQPLGVAYNVNNVSQTLLSVLSATTWNSSTGLLSNSAASSVWRRDFTNGIVIVNPTGSSQTVSLGSTFKKITGLIDPTFNNGATGITSITLTSHSAVILHR